LIHLEEQYKTNIIIEGSPTVLPQEGHIEYIAGESP
jgi:hypothetical protein